MRLLSDGNAGWEAGLCYVLFVAAFAMDLSIMSLVYLASMLLVPLLVQQPVRLYWKAMLVYTEVGVAVSQRTGAPVAGLCTTTWCRYISDQPVCVHVGGHQPV